MPRIVWDEVGKKFYEMGVRMGVLYPYSSTEKKYAPGVAWNGLTKVGDEPEGAEATNLWADDQKYASFRSAEDFKGSIECYTYPDEFEPCLGYAEPVKGMKVTQQGRSTFGLSYRNAIGSDTDPDATEYKLHLVYGATASPFSQDHETINDSPDAATLSFEFETVPVPVELEDGKTYKPTSHIVIDSRTVDKKKLAELEKKLYGDEGDPELQARRKYTQY